MFSDSALHFNVYTAKPAGEQVVEKELPWAILSESLWTG